MPTIIVNAILQSYNPGFCRGRFRTRTWPYNQRQIIVWAMARACRYGFLVGRSKSQQDIDMPWAKPSELFRLAEL